MPGICYAVPHNNRNTHLLENISLYFVLQQVSFLRSFFLSLYFLRPMPYSIHLFLNVTVLHYNVFTKPVYNQMSRGSSGSIVSDYGLDDRTIEVRSPTEAEDFSSSPCVQTGSGAHPASYPMGTGGPFPGGKARPGRDADYSSPSSAEVKYE
jgi:hypothetical protein